RTLANRSNVSVAPIAWANARVCRRFKGLFRTLASRREIAMNNLKAAFEAAELLANEATERSKGELLRIEAAVPPTDEFRQHCFDPWVIGRVLPRAHQTAALWLKRAGFEAWFPAGRHFSMMPKRNVCR